MRKLNIYDGALDETLDEHGFRHRAATVALDGAERIRAVVYAAEPGVPIWPYHFHRGPDELVYVISARPSSASRAASAGSRPATSSPAPTAPRARTRSPAAAARCA